MPTNDHPASPSQSPPGLAVRKWRAASPALRRAVVDDYAGRAASIIGRGLEALRSAGLDMSLPSAPANGPAVDSLAGTPPRGGSDGPIPEAVLVAEIARRHRDMIGRLNGFGPAEYAEMVASVRMHLGELHPEDARDLAPDDLWQGQDRWTGEDLDTDPKHTDPNHTGDAAHTRVVELRTRAIATLRDTAASALSG